MSLLLDARKKSQSAQSALGGDSVPAGLAIGQETHQDLPPLNDNRLAGRNLFNAKYPDSSFARAGINRNLLLALGGTVLFLAVGAGYVWYSISGDHVQSQRAIDSRPVASLPQRSSVETPIKQPAQILAETTPRKATPTRTSRPSRKAHTAKNPAMRPLEQTQPDNSLRIEQQVNAIDPLLNGAYLAYRSGKYEQAQQQYQEVLKLDARNTDALLGMAVIAQHRGLDKEAAHYYSRTLMLDPRNAIANAGMSAITTDNNRESRLKILLREQQDSPSLHFALGNLYAEQSRWGEAQQSYANAYKLDPDNPELAFNFAVGLDRLGQKKSAAQYYQRALQLDHSHSAGFDHEQIELRVQELTR